MRTGERFRKASNLVIKRLSSPYLIVFFITHLLASLVLCGLSLAALATHIEASHLLRHIVDQANLSSIVFSDPHTGVTQDWRTFPAIVTNISASGVLDGDGMICNDDGTRCYVYQSGGNGMETSTTSVLVPSTTRTPSSISAGSVSSTRPQLQVNLVTTLNVVEGKVLTTVLQVVPTLTVVGGKVASTNVPVPTISTNLIPARPTPTPSSTALPSLTSSIPLQKSVTDKDTHIINILGGVFARYMAKRDITLSTVEANSVVVGVNVHGVHEYSTDAKEAKGDDDDDGDDDADDDDKDDDEVHNGVFVSRQCALSFAWPINSLDNLVREEIVLASFFVWTLSLAIVTLLNESIPHLFALLASLSISTGWSGYTLHASSTFTNAFMKTVVTGPCNGNDVLPDYQFRRRGFQIAVLSINSIILVVSAFLTWKLLDRFGWHTFKRIGASSKISRLYKLVLCLGIILQLDAFILIAFFAIWLDQITSGLPGCFIGAAVPFKVVYTILILTILPWIYFGWTSSRTENRRSFNIFLALSSLLVAGWAGSFSDKDFRLEFSSWKLFLALGVLGVILTLLALTFAVTRRMTFGQGLSEYLQRQEIPDSKEEKVASAQTVGGGIGVPTFSSAFPLGIHVPPIRSTSPVAMLPRPAQSWQEGDDRIPLALGRPRRI